MTKTFFIKERAERFAADLARMGCKTQIWTGRDGFGQTIFTVKW